MAEPITITMSAATILLIAERVADRIGRYQNRPGKASGEKDPSFWQQEFREALDEKLEQRVLPIMDRQTSILESLARTIEGIATELNRKRGR